MTRAAAKLHPIDLPTALRNWPTPEIYQIAFAHEQIRTVPWALVAPHALWLPSIRAGHELQQARGPNPGHRRHDFGRSAVVGLLGPVSAPERTAGGFADRCRVSMRTFNVADAVFNHSADRQAA